MQFHFCVFLSRLSELVWKLAGEIIHQLAVKRFPSLGPPANGNEINAKKSRFRANRNLMGTIYNCSAILRSFSVVSNSAKRDANRFFKVLLLSSHRLISRQDKQKSKFCACAKIGILFLWTWGAFHLLRNSENSSWDVDGTHVFRTFHWKVPGNNWIFKKGSPSCFPFGNFRWKSMFHLRVFTRNHRQFQAIQARRYLCYHLEFWWRTHKRMELVSNGTHSSLDGPFHGSFRKFLVKRLWTLVNGDNRHLILAQPRDSRRKPTSLMRALHSHFRAVLRLSILFGRHGPNRVIEFACFDSKLQ